MLLSIDMKLSAFWRNEIYLHRLFDISIIIKGILAGIETIGGFLVLFISQQFIINLVLSITQDEISDDPNDFLANFLIHWAQSYSISSQHFIALYLISHGVIKGVLVICLLKEKLWSYPLAMGVFSLFGLYQLVEFAHKHSLWLLVLTVLDVLIIALTLHEYRYMKRTGKKPKWDGEEPMVDA